MNTAYQFVDLPFQSRHVLDGSGIRRTLRILCLSISYPCICERLMNGYTASLYLSAEFCGTDRPSSTADQENFLLELR